MKILAIDTSTEACSVALLDNQQILEEYCIAPQQHSKIILAMVEKILAQGEATVTQLNALAFGRGPGSFTGVRIAASVIQGLAFAAELPVVPVSTLQAIAQGARREFGAQAILAAIDARMNEVYWAEYTANSAGVMQLVAAEQVNRPEDIKLSANNHFLGVGSGWISYKDGLYHALGNNIINSYEYYPHAQDIAYLAMKADPAEQYVTAEHAIPVYIRDNVAQAKNIG